VIRVSKFWPHSRSAAARTAPVLVVNDSLDELDAFGSESELATPVEALAALPPPEVKPASMTSAKATMWLTWLLVVTLSAGAAAATVWQYQNRAAATAAGTLTIQTPAPGAEVFIAGSLAGRTPLTTSLRAGSYDVRVTANGQSRDFKIAVTPGASVVRELEFAPATAPAVAATGALHVQTELRQAVVAVDGVDRGSSPLTVDGLQPGDHQVVVKSERGTFRRVVQIKPRETLSLMISASEPTAIVPGWLAVTSPTPMQLREDGKLIGTSETERLMLSSGEHEIEISNEALGYRVTRHVTITPGKTTTTALDLPTGLLSVNATPWAEVFIDGERIGETPLANLSRRIGSHQVVFRHPQLGERTETVMLTLKQPARLGIDMRRQ